MRDEEFFDDMINGETWHKPDDSPSQDNEIENWLGE